MSDRDRQRKHEQENNISGSLYARVNVGQDASQDILDGSSVTPIAGSMNNGDERVPYDSHCPYPFWYYVLGVGFSVLIGSAIFWLFRGYFYGEGMNQVLPSAMLLVGALGVGFLSAKFILRKKKIR